MAICARLGGRCAGLLSAAVVRACADALARIDVAAPEVVLALAAVAAAAEALIAVKAAMSPAATGQVPRRMLFTARQ
jgi:hypothetical protein